MVNEAWTFGGATGLTVVGLVVMLYGVSLNDGLVFNELMAIGGAIVAVGIIVMTWGVGSLEDPHHVE